MKHDIEFGDLIEPEFQTAHPPEYFRVEEVKGHLVKARNINNHRVHSFYSDSVRIVSKNEATESARNEKRKGARGFIPCFKYLHFLAACVDFLEGVLLFIPRGLRKWRNQRNPEKIGVVLDEKVRVKKWVSKDGAMELAQPDPDKRPRFNIVTGRMYFDGDESNMANSP